MEFNIFNKIIEKVENGQRAALLTSIKKTGVSAGKPGMIMAVFQDGSSYGTIGGGNLEYKAVKEAKDCIISGENKYVKVQKDDINDDCGNTLEVFIKIFKPKNKLLIIGCGHVGTNIYNVARTQNFDIALFDDREEYCNRRRFPNGELILGDVVENLKNYLVNDNTYIAVCRHSHYADQEVLESLLKRDFAYIGMLGSNKKIESIKKNLLAKGITESEFEKLYAPIGIDIGSSSPDELGIGILAQILMVKNKKLKKSENDL
ncbi:MAG: XdhC/CoxI family protein [Andreesenia angusta]|nr:XdhC/CoxI family protein [Andreesenia angusta]